jgi:nucleolar GTP-binding protein
MRSLLLFGALLSLLLIRSTTSTSVLLLSLLQISTTAHSAGARIVSLSNATDEGVMNVRNTACDMLMDVRTEAKKAGSRIAEVAHRLGFTVPRKRDSKARPAVIPASVRAQVAAAAADDDEPMDATAELATAALGRRRRGVAIGSTAAAAASSSGSSSSSSGSDEARRRRLEVDLEREAGGAGVYSADWTKTWQLKQEEWNRDAIPEILDGKNVADFVDTDIVARLERLEAEEAALSDAYAREAAVKAAAEAAKTPLDVAQTLAEQGLAHEVRKQRKLRTLRSNLKQATNYSIMGKNQRGRTVTKARLAAHLEELGLPAAGAAAVAAAAPSHKPSKRGRSVSRRGDGEDDDGDVDMEGDAAVAAEDTDKPKRTRSRSRSIVPGLAEPEQGSGYRDIRHLSVAVKAARQAQHKMQSEGRKGEADRFIGTKMPKHLFTGKRGLGTANHS